VLRSRKNDTAEFRTAVANYVLPKTWTADRERRARIIGEWLTTEARFLA
jgi:hypothetical protein